MLDMGKKKTGKVVNCDYCEQPIYQAAWQLRDYKHHYCSRKCKGAHKSASALTTMICKQCSKRFSLLAGETRRRRQFCSRKCRGIANRRRATVTCPACDKTFETHIKWPSRCCSKECAYTANRKKQIIKCAKCRKEFWSYPSKARVYCSRECFRKATTDFRKTEKFVLGKIDAVLGHQYSCLREHTFPWLKNPETKYHLYLDVFYPDLNLAIEYNGALHYKENEYFDTHYNTLERRQQRDKTKAALLVEHNIQLLIIKYDEPRTTQHYRKRLREFGIPV